jgi:SAM-dependent methyltransferase
MIHAPERSRHARIAALGYEYERQPVRVRSACNLCCGERFVTVTHRDRYRYPVRADGCLRCGLVFLNPVMTAGAYAKFYGEVYRPLVSAYHGYRIDSETLQDEQREYAEACAEVLAPHLEDRGARTLLDVGGSTGVVAHHFKKRFDLNATVIDPAPLEIDVARRLGLRAVTGFVEECDLGEQRFDLIILCQTVDHLLDVSLSLRKIRSLLREDGLFFVDIVDFRADYLRNDSVEEAIKIDHPFYLTETTALAFLRSSGFDVLAVNYAADHLHVGYVCAPAPARADFLPSRDDVSRQWREIRLIQGRLPDR